MLNRISLTDIISYIAGKVRLLVCSAVIFALVLGCLKFALIRRAGLPSELELEELRSACEKSETEYKEGLSRFSELPVNRMDPYCTYKTGVLCEAVIHDETAAASDISVLMQAVLNRWEISDLKEYSSDLFPEIVDDGAIRQVIELKKISDNTLVITTRGSSEKESEDIAKTFLSFVMSLIEEEEDRSESAVSIVVAEPVTKCVYDYSVTVDRLSEKERLETAFEIWQSDHARYTEALHRSDIVRPCIKWALLGAVLGTVTVLLIMAVYVILYEPMLSSEHIIRQTGLEDLGSLKQKDYNSAFYKTSLKNGLMRDTESGEMEYAVLRAADKLTEDGKILLISTGHWDESTENVQAFMQKLQDIGTKAEHVRGETGDPEFIRKLRNASNAILIVRYGRTFSRDTERIIEIVKEYNCKIIGFICV